MTQNFQISKRLDDGTIVIIGAKDYETFAANVRAAMSDADASHALRLFSQLGSPAANGITPPAAFSTYR